MQTSSLDMIRRFSAAALALLVVAAPARAACRVESGVARAALVELYTSEGCSSCPPADRQLRTLTRVGPRVVPLALHVDYWDSIGWKDPFAQPSFTQRQAWEVRANRHRTSFTPHFFVNGKEVPDWRADLDFDLQADIAPASAHIVVAAERLGNSGVHLKVDGSVAAGGAAHGPLQMFVVVTESGLSSQVSAGENRGARLDHDAVARNWIGPIALSGNSASLERTVDIPQPAAGRLGVVAFIQDTTSAEVLQAVDTGVCKAI